jgi:hypothetical protein
MEKRYTYCIQPRRVIKDLPDVGNIRTPKILQLTKEEVLICMKSGHVFRRFAAESRNERVTSDNLDRLHNDKFMTEKEYKEFLKNSDVVDEKKDKVTLDGTVLKLPQEFVYLKLNKPKGYACTASDEKGRKTVFDLVESDVRLFNVGRLDYDT